MQVIILYEYNKTKVNIHIIDMYSEFTNKK